MSYCSNCGNELNEKDIFCSNCGNKINDNVETVIPNESKPVLRCFTIFGNVGYILGIITIILSFIPILGVYAIAPGVHGIVFSALGKKDVKQLKKCKKGLTLSIIGTIVGFVFFFVWIILIAELFD